MTNQEIIEVIQAHEEGKTIQYENGITGEWFSVKTPEWNFQKWRYRVKPEPEPTKYEPFGFEDDLVGRSVIISESKYMITGQSNKKVHIINCGWIYYKDLLDNYTFADGAPCGKLLEL